jgi:glycosyltransferase involved in cell wall biosynthesis
MGLSISLVTPSLNQGGYIERTIQSVLAQDVPGLDYLVCDGGSEDGTVDILRGRKGLRWSCEPDGGQADAINRGIGATSGDVVGWLNSDDVLRPGALRAVLAVFQAHPEVDLVYGGAHHIDANDAVLEPYPVEEWNYERLKHACFLCQPAVFFRRRVVERHGLLDERLTYCMDYEYWLRIGPHVRVARLERTLAGSRLHDQAKTIRDRVAVHTEINDMLLRRLGRVPDRWIFNYAFAVVDGAGYSRSRPQDYLGLLVSSSVRGFLRWRRRLPVSLLQQSARWTWQAHGPKRSPGARP